MTSPGGPEGEPLSAQREASPMSGAAVRYECKICWTVYDPQLGDPVWQIAPGTPFEDLPPHWTCPNCFNEKTGFLRLDDD